MARRKPRNLHQQFSYYNRKYFKRKLRLSALAFGSMRSSHMGETTFYDNKSPSIKLNKVLTKFGSYARMILLHEMTHASLPLSVGHGPRFIRRIHRLVRQGAYDDLL